MSVDEVHMMCGPVAENALNKSISTEKSATTYNHDSLDSQCLPVYLRRQRHL